MEVGLKQNNKRAEKLIVDFSAHNKNKFCSNDSFHRTGQSKNFFFIHIANIDGEEKCSSR